MNIFSVKLRECLKEMGMSQLELARRLNMAKSTLNDYCTGKTSPSLEVFRKICIELNESADYLLGLEDLK